MNNNNIGKIGGYAITTVHSMPWLSTPIKQKNTTKGKGHRQKAPQQILNSIFEECAQLIDDPYWKATFQQAAYGKLPRGFIFKNNNITYKRGNKTQRIEVPENPVEAISVCINFFKNIAGIRSKIDQEREKLEIEESMSKIKPLNSCNWSDIKRKRIRELLINSFIRTMSITMHLSKSETDQLSTLINIGFILGYFTSDSVVFENGSIKSIRGLLYDPDNHKFVFDTSIIERKSNKSKVKIIYDEHLFQSTNSNKYQLINLSFMNLWRKFLEPSDSKDSKSHNSRYSESSFNEDDSTSSPLYNNV